MAFLHHKPCSDVAYSYFGYLKATSIGLSLLAILNPTQIFAADFTIIDGQTVGQQTLLNGDTATVLSGGTITAAGDGIASNANNPVSIFNAGTITSTGDDGIEIDETITDLMNSGLISGFDDGVVARNIETLINSGTITGGDRGITISDNATTITNTGLISGVDDALAANDIESLTNSGSITGGDKGIWVNNINTFTNTGLISGGGDAITAVNDLVNLYNYGTITGGDKGIEADNIINLVNHGTITAVDDGVVALTLITSLINTGTITAGDDALNGNTITSLINSGTITAGNDAVEFNTITSLTNSGTITAVDEALNATTITSLTNSGKITGGTFAIHETGAANSLLTLLSGSDISGAIHLGGGVNTLVIGKGLSIDHVFAGLPDVINSNGAPLAIVGNRVVVVDTSAFAQQDEQLFDLSQGIWGTVFNNIGDGRNPAAVFANGTIPQYSLGAVPPGEIAGNDRNTHMWASVFGNHRIQDGTSPAASARHNLGGLIAGLDGWFSSNIRLGAFFGTSETDIDTANDQQETEVENIFGGLYASFKTDRLTIDFGVTGGATEHENTRLVDNNQVNGLETASSSFDGSFIAPELSISSKINLRGTILQPTLRVGYAGLFLDSYTETGGSAPLTASDRDLHLLHARFEVAAIMTSSGEDSLAFTFSPYVGVEGRSLVGGETVDVTLLGQNLSFTPGGNDDTASAFAGLRLSVLQTDNLRFFAGIEGSIDTEQSSTITGNFGIKWRF